MDGYGADSFFSFGGVSVEGGDDSYDNDQNEYIDPDESFYPQQSFIPQDQQSQVQPEDGYNVMGYYPGQQQMAPLDAIQPSTTIIQQQQQEVQSNFGFVPQNVQASGQWGYGVSNYGSGIPPISSAEPEQYVPINPNSGYINGVNQQQQSQLQFQQQQQQQVLQNGMYNGSPDAMPDSDSNSNSPEYSFIKVNQQQPQITSQNGIQQGISPIMMGIQNANGSFSPQDNMNNNAFMQSQMPAGCFIAQPSRSTHSPQSLSQITPPPPPQSNQNGLFTTISPLSEERSPITGALAPIPVTVPIRPGMKTSSRSSSSSSSSSSSCGSSTISIRDDVEVFPAKKKTRTIQPGLPSEFTLGKLTQKQLCTMSIDSFESYVKDQRKERALTQEEETQVKKIRRTIKNRASASKSRIKKYQHTLDLENYVLYLQGLLRSNGIQFREFTPSENNNEEEIEPLTSSPTSSALVHNKRKGQFMLAGIVFFALMMFFFKGTFAPLIGFGSYILSGGSSGIVSREGLHIPGGSIIGGSTQFQAQMPPVIQPQDYNSVRSMVESLRNIKSIENQSVPNVSYPNGSQNDYVIDDATEENTAPEKISPDFYNIGGEEKEEEEENSASLLVKSDVIFSNENSPVVPQKSNGNNNNSKEGERGGEYAGCNAAFPGIEPRTYEAGKWSSKESVPYLFCNDVKHYKPMKKVVEVDGEENEVCEVQGNRTVGIIIPSSSISGPDSDGNDDLIELVCTIDEINFIRRNSSVNSQPHSQSPVVRKTNLPKIVP